MLSILSDITTLGIVNWVGYYISDASMKNQMAFEEEQKNKQ
jgi:hypothetical protein